MGASSLRGRAIRHYSGLGVPARSRGWLPVGPRLLVLPFQFGRRSRVLESDGRILGAAMIEWCHPTVRSELNWMTIRLGECGHRRRKANARALIFRRFKHSSVAANPHWPPCS